MRLEDFDYPLPEKLIAQYPLKNRADARLLVVSRAGQTIRHDIFKNILRYLPAGSPLVVNNSKVIPARLLGIKERSGGRVEIFLLQKGGLPGTYEVLLRPARKLKNGDRVRFPGHRLQAEVVDVSRRLVRFNTPDVLKELAQVGHMPLPPYIKRGDTGQDRQEYQTVYARYPGSVAAPTAGLHFTSQLVKDIKRHGHEVVPVTLHVNYGTFRPVEEQDVRQHRMHEERYSVSAANWQRLCHFKRRGKKIVSVGTTSCRVLETVAQRGPRQGITDLFLAPGDCFAMTDVLITNFHLPRSSLLMLVYAFGTTALMKRAYREAIKEKYRFYSYGDAMIIL